MGENDNCQLRIYICQQDMVMHPPIDRCHDNDGANNK